LTIQWEIFSLPLLLVPPTTVNILKKLPQVNRLDKKNCTETYIWLPTGNISFGEFKCLLKLTDAEKLIIMEKSEQRYASVPVNWMVLSGFLMMISDLKLNGCISLTAQESGHIFRGNETSFLFATEYEDDNDYHVWKEIRVILIPYCQNNNHWVLLAVYPVMKEIHGNYSL